MGSSSARDSVGIGLLGLGLTLGASLVVCAALLGKTFLEARSQHQTVEVKGYAERRILSDLASWEGGFTTRAPTLEAAYAELAEQHAEVLSFLGEQGFVSLRVDLLHHPEASLELHELSHLYFGWARVDL